MNSWMHRTVAVLIGSLMGLALLPGLGFLIGFEPPLFRDGDSSDPCDYMCPGGSMSLEFEDPVYDWTCSEWELNLLDVVLRRQFADNPASPDAFEVADHVFLGLEGPDGLLDPPPGLLSRLEDLRPIEPASLSEPAFRGSVRHREREGRSIMFVVAFLRPIDDSTIEVEITYRGACSSGHVYRVEQRDGEWVVVDGEMRWIS